MKKTIVGMALMAMALVGFNGMAQNTTQGQKAQVENKSCCQQGDKKCDGKKGMKKEARTKMNPYEGLTLTEAQKGKLAELDAKRAAKRQAAMETRKADGKKGDKKSMTDAEKQAAKQAKMQARRAEQMDYLQEVKAIVGPDQYVVFLENMYVNGGQPGGGKAIKQGQKDRKDGRKGMAHNQRKGDRKGGQRAQKGAQSRS